MLSSMNSITQLQYQVLDSMMDDAEDVEQLYLGVRDQFALRDVIDAVNGLLLEGLIEIRYTNDEATAPLNPINHAMIHHYWFGPTSAGKSAWQSFADANST